MTTPVEMSVTRALATLKGMQARIDAATKTQEFVRITVGTDEQRRVANRNETVAEAEARLKGNFQSAFDLINYRHKLKSAIVKSNADTLVKINGRELTVSSAIELKSYATSLKQLLATMRTQYNAANNTVESLNKQLDDKINSSMAAIYGKDVKGVDANAYRIVSAPLIAKDKASVLDSINIPKTVETLAKEVELIETEIDYVLSESNALTKITV